MKVEQPVEAPFRELATAYESWWDYLALISAAEGRSPSGGGHPRRTRATRRVGPSDLPLSAHIDSAAIEPLGSRSHRRTSRPAAGNAVLRTVRCPARRREFVRDAARITQ